MAYELISQFRSISSCCGVVHSMVVAPLVRSGNDERLPRQEKEENRKSREQSRVYRGQRRIKCESKGGISNIGSKIFRFGALSRRPYIDNTKYCVWNSGEAQPVVVKADRTQASEFPQAFCEKSIFALDKGRKQPIMGSKVVRSRGQ